MDPNIKRPPDNELVKVIGIHAAQLFPQSQNRAYTPPIFKNYCPPILWLILYEVFALKSNWEDNDRLNNLVNYLQSDEEAALWFRSSEFESWQDFVIKFVSKFEIIKLDKYLNAMPILEEKLARSIKSEKKYVSIYKDKMDGYSSTFIMTTVLGFVPAVLSCDISENFYPIFVLILCILSISSLHMLMYFILYQSGKVIFGYRSLVKKWRVSFELRINYLRKEVLAKSINIDDALELADIEVEKMNAIIKKYSKYSGWLRYSYRWFNFERIIQILVASVSTVVVILLLHPLKKFENMERIEVSRFIFTVWLYVVNFALIFFKMPSRDFDLIDIEQTHYATNTAIDTV